MCGDHRNYLFIELLLLLLFWLGWNRIDYNDNKPALDSGCLAQSASRAKVEGSFYGQVTNTKTLTGETSLVVWIRTSSGCRWRHGTSSSSPFNPCVQFYDNFHSFPSQTASVMTSSHSGLTQMSQYFYGFVTIN